MSELNSPIWKRTVRGHYEGWFITLVDPQSGRGFWFRYTLFVPLSPDQPAKASLWAFSFDHADPSKGAEGRADHELASFRPKDKGFHIDLGAGVLNDKGAKGQVETSRGLMSWDLKFGDNRLSWQHFNPDLFERGVSQTCVNSPRLDVDISGTITLGEESFKLTKAPGEQSHIWGRSPTRHYNWVHCNAFKDAPGAVFEGLAARLEKGGLLLPPGGPMLLSLPGRRFEVRGLLEMFQLKHEAGYGFWRFEAEKDEVLLVGRVSVAPEQVVTVEYESPRGPEWCYCHNSIVADMSLKVYTRLGARWVKERELVSEGTTAFEINRPEPDPAVERRLLLSDGYRVG